MGRRFNRGGYPQIKTGRYHAKKVKCDGYTFDSTAEFNRYTDLLIMQSAGLIRDLEVHGPNLKFELMPKYKNGEGKNIRAMYYEADFKYFDVEKGEIVVEDVKGGRVDKKTGKMKSMVTEAFKIKKKLFDHKYYPMYISVVYY